MTPALLITLALSVGERDTPMPRYLAALDALALRAMGVNLPLRDLGRRWGVSHVTARRWVEEAEAMPLEVSPRPEG